MPIMSSRGDTESVRRCLAHSLFMSTAELQPDGTYATTDTHQPVAIHPSSVLFHCKPACVVYTELLHTNKCYMRDLCVVDAEWLYEAAPEYFRRKLRTARNWATLGCCQNWELGQSPSSQLTSSLAPREAAGFNVAECAWLPGARKRLCLNS